MLRDAIWLVIGVCAGWIIFERPQWASNAWAWVKGKFSKSPPATPVTTTTQAVPPNG